MNHRTCPCVCILAVCRLLDMDGAQVPEVVRWIVIAQRYLRRIDRCHGAHIRVLTQDRRPSVECAYSLLANRKSREITRDITLKVVCHRYCTQRVVPNVCHVVRPHDRISDRDVDAGRRISIGSVRVFVDDDVALGAEVMRRIKRADVIERSCADGDDDIRVLIHTRRAWHTTLRGLGWRQGPVPRTTAWLRTRCGDISQIIVEDRHIRKR